MIVKTSIWVLEAKKILKRPLLHNKENLRNLSKLFAMDMVYNIGLMELIMKDIGVITKPKDKELSGMLKETFTEVSSKMIWQMGMENILTLTGPNTRASSKMTCRKDTVKKNGLMVPNMLAATKTE